MVITDISDGTQTVDSIKKAGGDAIFVKVDVTKSADIQALVRKTLETYGLLEVAVNNAGVGGPAAMTGDYTEEDWKRVIRKGYCSLRAAHIWWMAGMLPNKPHMRKT